MSLTPQGSNPALSFTAGAALFLRYLPARRSRARPRAMKHDGDFRFASSLPMKPSEALQRHRDAIRRIVERHDATNPRVFGSVAQGCDTHGNDLERAPL